MLALLVIVIALVANNKKIRRSKFNGNVRAPTSVGKSDDNEESDNDKEDYATNCKALGLEVKKNFEATSEEE